MSQELLPLCRAAVILSPYFVTEQNCAPVTRPVTCMLIYFLVRLLCAPVSAVVRREALASRLISCHMFGGACLAFSIGSEGRAWFCRE